MYTPRIASINAMLATIHHRYPLRSSWKQASARDVDVEYGQANRYVQEYHTERRAVHSTPRLLGIVFALFVAGSFVAEYYSEYCRRASEREAAMRVQPPPECSELEKQPTAASSGSLVSYLLFQGKTTMLETCRLYWDRYHLAVGRSLWPSPLLIATRMLSQTVLTPLELFFSVFGNAALDLLQRLHLDDKIWFLVLFIVLPIGFCYAFLHRPRKRDFDEAYYTHNPNPVFVTTDGLMRTFETELR